MLPMKHSSERMVPLGLSSVNQQCCIHVALMACASGWECEPRGCSVNGQGCSVQNTVGAGLLFGILQGVCGRDVSMAA